MNKTVLGVAVIAVVLIGGMGVFFIERTIAPSEPPQSVAPNASLVLSFEDCARAGYPVMESYPRRCNTPDGKTFEEEIPEYVTYENASADDIVVELPFPGAVVGKQFSVIGKARAWYFEASFPVKVLDAKGNILAQGLAHAQEDWMTSEFVPFKIDLTVPQSYSGPATLRFEKDNPSGLPQNDAAASFPITIE